MQLLLFVEQKADVLFRLAEYPGHSGCAQSDQEGSLVLITGVGCCYLYWHRLSLPCVMLERAVRVRALYESRDFEMAPPLPSSAVNPEPCQMGYSAARRLSQGFRSSITCAVLSSKRAVPRCELQAAAPVRNLDSGPAGYQPRLLSLFKLLLLLLRTSFCSYISTPGTRGRV